jgi:catechol 2,3-dioxygenase-like lactoylglutathione lyase family enzyme
MARTLINRARFRRGTMAKIKHIALSTQDVERTARFYIEVFGLKRVGEIDDPGTRGCFLSDGEVNLAILNFKNDEAAGIERGKAYSGIHHIGFHVESLSESAEKLRAAGSARRDDVNQALRIGQGRQDHGNVEVKYSGPDGIMLDVSETGWIGTE